MYECFAPIPAVVFAMPAYKVNQYNKASARDGPLPHNKNVDGHGASSSGVEPIVHQHGRSVTAEQ